MAVEGVNIFPPEPSIWMCLSAFSKASVILDRHTHMASFERTKPERQLGSQEALFGVIIYSHGLYDVAYFVLVGSSVETVSCMEHVVQIAHLLLKRTESLDSCTLS